MPSNPVDSGEVSSRLAYVPGLDGLRGAAVVAVLLFHGGHLAGGYLGVDLFFVLSGFLITSLLLAEGGASGHIGLAHFWERRARRLLPALAVLLVGVAAYAWLVATPEELHRIRLDGLATMLYVANWRDIFARTDYFALFSAPSPLEHTWSLAIEEQFYLVWPLVFVALVALARRHQGATRHRLAGLALGLSVGLGVLSGTASLLLVRFQGWNRVYYGTDTRAFAILAGAAVASLRVRNGPVRGPRARRLLEAAGVLGVLVLAVCWARLGFGAQITHRGGLLACSLAGALVVAATSHPTRGVVSRTASFTPLRWAGLISYGLYLYHWPIFVWLSAERVHLTGWPLFAVQCAVTLMVSVVSYVALEQPIRHGSGWPTTAKTLVPLGSFLAVGALLVASTSTSALPQANVTRRDLEQASTKADKRAGPKILVVGNSVGYYLAADGLSQLHSSPQFTYLSEAFYGCNYPGTDRFRKLDGSETTQFTRSCDRGWQADARAFRPNYVLYLRDGLGPDSFHHDGQFLAPCSSAFQDWYGSLLTQDAKGFRAVGARMALVTSAPSYIFEFDPHVDFPAYVRTVGCGNAVLRRAAAEHPDLFTLVDLDRHFCKPDGKCTEMQGGTVLRTDGTHYKGVGAQIVATWILDQLGIHATRR